MNDYVIFTDSACDVDPALLKEWGVLYRNLTFRFGDDEKEYRNDEMPSAVFYARMRAGTPVKTSAVSEGIFHEAFEELLREGKDILYVGFSSGLSGTYNAGRIAAEELRPAWPDRKIITVDTLAASTGEGLLVWHAVQKKKAGASIEETAAWLEENKLRLCHWFTVDDLKYLRMGGRISAASAFLGTKLNIKPVLHVDNAGHLVKMSTVRGRKASLRAMVKKVEELSLGTEDNPIFLSHGDCMEDVELLRAMLREQCGRDLALVQYVGPVIGGHSGPGTMAIFFLGKER